MTEPTIDEMIAYVRYCEARWPADAESPDSVELLAAIRAILEQQRTETLEWARPTEQIGLEAIRAFVERVEKKAHATAAPYYWCKAFAKAVGEELAAMEKEAE